MKYLLMLLALAAALSPITGASGANGGATDSLAATAEQRPYSDTSSVALAFENDVLAGGANDKDYTYGLNLTYTGPAARDAWLSPQPLEHWLNDTLTTKLLPGLKGAGATRHSLEFGVYGFTPDDIELAEPIADDRPYASLVYMASYTETVNHANNESWQSGLSIGILGLDVVGSAQNTVHDWIDSSEARGWHNQISDGGEPTAKYTLAHQKLIGASEHLELKSTVQGSVGYLTEASYALSFRAGQIRSDWWSFDPELTSYGEKSVVNAEGLAVSEHYLWGGIAVKARAYNAFLQGQFRDSAVSYQADALNHGLIEAWLGYTLAFNNSYRLSYVLRGHTSEIKTGRGDRSLLWGGLVVARSF